ncbi:MAG: hypothetical protein DDT37_01890 [Firmicutes bacterium]|nr:hypothetical protein [candidate division NPL-UPA2 bacterium]
MFNAHDPFSTEFLHPVAARTTTGNGASIDIKDYIGRGKVMLDCAAGTGTTPTLDIVIQHSVDNVTFIPVPGAVFAQVTTAARQQQIGLDLDAAHRHVRIAFTIAGGTPSFTFSVQLVGWRQL